MDLARYIPTYGLRRNIDKHFNYETALGFSYEWVFQKITYFNGETGSYTDSGTLFNFRLAFGYVF